jgi:hypothetical protein
MIILPLPQVVAKLTCPGLLPKWVRYIFGSSMQILITPSYRHQLIYYDHWMELSRFTRQFIQRSSYGGCNNVTAWQAAFFNTFAYNPRCVFSPPPIPTGQNCSYIGNCHKGDMNTLFSELSRKGKDIPMFTSIQISS